MTVTVAVIQFVFNTLVRLLCLVFMFAYCMFDLSLCSFSTLILLVGSFDL